MPLSSTPSTPILGPFAERLLASDLPDLPAPQRREVVAFIGHRVDSLPSFTRFGVLAIGSVFRVLIGLPAGWAIAGIVMKLPIPFVGEYPRLIRSLGFAYIWEHWPATTPTGAIGPTVAA